MTFSTSPEVLAATLFIDSAQVFEVEPNEHIALVDLRIENVLLGVLPTQEN